jgi:hypothetical protein
MTCRERKRQRQYERDVKIANDILTGRATYVMYENRNKPAQRNMKGGGTNTEGGADGMATQAMGLARLILPGILYRLSQIEDYRDTRKIIHSVEALGKRH